MAIFAGYNVLSKKILRDQNALSRGVGFARYVINYLIASSNVSVWVAYHECTDLSLMRNAKRLSRPFMGSLSGKMVRNFRFVTQIRTNRRTSSTALHSDVSSNQMSTILSLSARLRHTITIRLLRLLSLPLCRHP